MKKIWLLSLALVLAMGTIGVAYAGWNQELVITEQVNTGKFCVGIRDVGTNDPGPSLKEGGVVHPVNPPVDGTNDPGYQKNVASAKSINVGDVKCTHLGDDFFHAVREEISNAYPSYSCTINLEFANCGTVPAKGRTVVTRVVSDPKGLAPFVSVSWALTLPDGTVVTGAGYPALEAALLTVQLDPCQRIRLELTKHIEQDVAGVVCPQEADLVVEETIDWVQWNEA